MVIPFKVMMMVLQGACFSQAARPKAQIVLGNYVDSSEMGVFSKILW
jgi:hypothetical protein